MKPLSTSPVKLLHRHFELFLFAAALLLEFHIFHTARAAGLLAPPMPGMDQHTILQAALALPSGVLPETAPHPLSVSGMRQSSHRLTRKKAIPAHAGAFRK